MGHKDIISKGILKRILLDMAVNLFQLDLIDAELLSTGRGSRTTVPIWWRK